MNKVSGRFLLLCACLLMAVNVHAEDYKIGFINIVKVMENAPQAAAARTKLSKEFEKREAELSQDQKRLREMEERMKRDAAILSEENRKSLEREILATKRELKRRVDAYREDANMRQNEELGNLQKEIRETIKEVAEQEKYDLILTNGVVFASKAVDITEFVLKNLDDKFQGGAKK